mgnify:CR=1 FL=1
MFFARAAIEGQHWVEGGSVPLFGGIVLDLCGLAGVRSVDAEEVLFHRVVWSFVVVVVVLRLRGEQSAADCAEGLGLSRVTARRYLEHYLSAGALELRLQYGVGRPERGRSCTDLVTTAPSAVRSVPTSSRNANTDAVSRVA